MPIVKLFGDQLEKFSRKYDGANVTTKLGAVKPIMDARYEAAVGVIYSVVETARDILSENGVPTGLWATYLGFAQILGKLTFSHKGATLEKEVSGLKSYFVTAHGADPKILDKIIAAVLGSVPAY